MFRMVSLFLCLSIMGTRILWAAEKEDTSSSKSTTQNVDGLYFDVDEGVKIEKGPGGSVYVKSNREYMQAKFEELDHRLADLEARVVRLEQKSENPSASPSPQNGKKETEHVLVTS